MTSQASALHPSTLPRRLRLSPHRSLLVRGQSARLLGLDPRTALAVDDLPPPLAGMLDELAAPTERVGLVARAVQRGADRDEAEELLQRLVDTGVLVDAEGPERVARQRAAAAVTVVGGGPLAAGVAAGLGRAGIGAVWVEAAADGAVQEGDLGTGLLDADRGRSALRGGGRRRPAGRARDERRAAPCPRRAGPVRARRRRRTRSHAGRRPAPRPRRAPARPVARRHRSRRAARASGSLGVSGVCRAAPAWPRPRLAGRHGPARRTPRPRRRGHGGGHRGARHRPGTACGGHRRWWRDGRAPGARRLLGARPRHGGTAAPPVAAPPGLLVWRIPAARTCEPPSGRGTIMR